MKHNLIKLSQAILLVIVMVFSSCENEELTAENSATSIVVAKSWFEDYRAKISFDPQFSDLIYNWQEASITRLTDGTQAITIPVAYPNEAPEYYGHKIMYLYPKNKGADYYVAVFEFIPNPKKVQTRQKSIDLTAFDGYIINWDLVHGFVNGAKFEQNLAVIPINVKIKDSDKRNNNSNKAAPIVALDEVVVYSKNGSPNNSGSYSFLFTRSYATFGSAASSGSFANSPHGGGGGGNGTASSNVSSINIETFSTPKIADVKKELKCFDLSSGAKVTIYADQPITGSRKLAVETGHTFIGITQNGVTRTIGFYPDSPEASLISDQTSEIHDNSTSAFDVSITIDVSASQLSAIANYITNYRSKFSLNNFNCTNFGIEVMSLGGLSLPKTIGTYSPILGMTLFKGINPADLGEDMRVLKLPAGATRNVTSGNAPAKSGTCK